MAVGCSLSARDGYPIQIVNGSDITQRLFTYTDGSWPYFSSAFAPGASSSNVITRTVPCLPVCVIVAGLVVDVYLYR